MRDEVSAPEPAVIIKAVGASAHGTPAVQLRLSSTGAKVVVSDLRDVAKLRTRFAPGDAVWRAMLDGREEDATAREGRVGARARCGVGPRSCAETTARARRAQVLRVDSATRVTIRVHHSGATYASDAKRLRLLRPRTRDVKRESKRGVQLRVQQALAATVPLFANVAVAAAMKLTSDGTATKPIVLD
jgi:hypothetical protein